MKQSEFVAITSNLLKAREKSMGFGFVSHWLKNVREILKPITKRSNRQLRWQIQEDLKTIWNLKCPLEKGLNEKHCFVLCSTLAITHAARQMQTDRKRLLQITQTRVKSIEIPKHWVTPGADEKKHATPL